jgi:nucleoside-triphosphatase THEP1
MWWRAPTVMRVHRQKPVSVSVYPMSQPLRLLLTGPPGIGKSTIVESVVGQLRPAGVSVGGFVTRELRDAQQRVGFVVDTLDGASAILAHVSLLLGRKLADTV